MSACSTQPECVVHHRTGADQDRRLLEQRFEQSLYRGPKHLQTSHGISLRLPDIQRDRAAVVDLDHQRAAETRLALMDRAKFVELLLATCRQTLVVIFEFAYYGVHLATCSHVSARIGLH